LQPLFKRKRIKTQLTNKKQNKMYKQASKEKFRFQTNKGMLSVEQLWDLSLTDLDSLAVSLEDAYKNSKGKSFLEKRTTLDKGLKLKFDIVLDVLQSKVEDNEVLRDAAETKEHNQKILSLIADKKEGELAGLSIKELEKKLK
jgi:hypothetical protein